MALAWVLGEQGRHEAAISVLDPSLAAQLPPREMASWLSGRAYYLATVGQFDDALSELERAEVILADDDDIDGQLTYTCVLGNRGLVALRSGRLDNAGLLIERAHRDCPG
jgi:tetratricopeptide (TPR) repeat protein